MSRRAEDIKCYERCRGRTYTEKEIVLTYNLIKIIEKEAKKRTKSILKQYFYSANALTKYLCEVHLLTKIALYKTYTSTYKYIFIH